MTSEHDMRLANIERDLITAAPHLPYPPTPKLKTPAATMHSSRVRPIRFAFTVAVILACFIAITVPEVRAAVITLFRIGGVTIELDGEAPNGQILRLEDITGETTLINAQASVDYTLYVSPTAPQNHVFLQQGGMVILVWVDGEKITRALYQIPNEDWGVIKSARSVEQTTVNGLFALWVDLRHDVEIVYQGDKTTARLNFVAGNVLIWEQGTMTYRLETREDMETARTFAASLIPVNPQP